MRALAGLLSTTGGSGSTLRPHPLIKGYCERRRLVETPERLAAIDRGSGIAQALLGSRAGSRGAAPRGRGGRPGASRPVRGEHGRRSTLVQAGPRGPAHSRRAAHRRGAVGIPAPAAGALRGADGSGHRRGEAAVRRRGRGDGRLHARPQGGDDPALQSPTPVVSKPPSGSPPSGAPPVGGVAQAPLAGQDAPQLPLAGPQDQGSPLQDVAVPPARPVSPSAPPVRSPTVRPPAAAASSAQPARSAPSASARGRVRAPTSPVPSPSPSRPPAAAHTAPAVAGRAASVAWTGKVTPGARGRRLVEAARSGLVGRRLRVLVRTSNTTLIELLIETPRWTCGAPKRCRPR